MKPVPSIKAILTHRCEVVLRQRARVEIRAGSDAVHDLRVATRRLQEALGLFVDQLPAGRRASLDRRSRRIRRALGTLRNADVLRGLAQRLSGRLPRGDRSALAALQSRLARTTRQLRAPDGRLRVHLPGIRRRANSLLRRTSGARRWPNEDALPALRRRVADLERALAAAAGGDPSAMHELRVSIKRYRYTLEILAEAFGKRLDRIIARARGLQTALGGLHDLDVLLEMLHELPASPARATLLERLGTRRQSRLKGSQRLMETLDAREPLRILERRVT